MLHPDTELRHVDARVGHGVFATRRIVRGTITWARDPMDQVLDPDVFDHLDAAAADKLWRHSYYDSRGDRVLCWDLARFMNHHCESNTLSPGMPFDVALRDIERGEEITTDYGALNLEEPFECACSARRCRGTVHPEDFEKYAAAWDERARAVFALIGGVEQPLWRWVRDKRAVERALADPARIPSILRNRWRDMPAVVTPPHSR